ncbi:MAG: hypothetical protein QM737_18795 [Ferruginibacter sp.]
MKRLIFLFSIIIAGCNNSDSNIDYPSGGYDFSKNISNRDFYCYPLIDKVSRRDSFWKAHFDAHVFKLFNEPNISLEPSTQSMVRLVYMGLRTYIIDLTDGEITIKTSDSSTMPRYDYSKLTETERLHFIILRRNYPINEAKPIYVQPAPKPAPGPLEEEQKKLDSIKNNTPVLLKREYYDYLIKKASIKDTFSFSTTRLQLTTKEFRKFIVMLNQSGYWTLPYDLRSESCIGTTDAAFLSLEINTGKKYNYVESFDACLDTNKFYKVCQQILKMAQINDQTVSLLQLH